MKQIILYFVIGIIGIGYLFGAGSEAVVPDDRIYPTFNELSRFLANDTTDEHEYNLNGYNCVNFSHALVANLSSVGFDCGYVLMTPYIIDDHWIPHLLVRAGDYVVEPINDEVKKKGAFEMGAYEIGFVVSYMDEYP